MADRASCHGMEKIADGIANIEKVNYSRKL